MADSWRKMEKLEKLEERRNKIRQGGGEAAVQKLLRPRGKLTAWERIELLFDRNTFREIGLWTKPIKTGFENIDHADVPRDAMIAGYGEVNGRYVYATSYDPTVFGGSQAAMQFEKLGRTMQQARQEGVPYVGIIDSGGRRIQDLFGRWSYRAPTRLPGCEEGALDMVCPPLASGVIPQISLILGPSVAGTAYSPVMADFVFFRRGTSHMAVASPQLLKAVTFKDVTWEEIGGAALHATTTGTCDVLVESDEEAIQQCRALLGYLPSNFREKAPMRVCSDDPDRREETLLGLVPDDAEAPYEIRDIIRLVLDAGSFFELQPLFAPHLVIGFGRIAGEVVGMIANNPMVHQGALDADACDKEARFIRFCDAFNIPLIFLVDTPGFLYSAQMERGREGLARHAAKCVFAICESTVPSAVVYLRRCDGSGRIIMGTREMGIDAAFAWPEAQIRLAVPGWSDCADQLTQACEEPFVSAGHFVVDDIIDPRETRPVLIQTFARLRKKECPGRPWRKHGLIPL